MGYRFRLTDPYAQFLFLCSSIHSVGFCFSFRVFFPLPAFNSQRLFRRVKQEREVEMKKRRPKAIMITTGRNVDKYSIRFRFVLLIFRAAERAVRYLSIYNYVLVARSLAVSLAAATAIDQFLLSCGAGQSPTIELNANYINHLFQKNFCAFFG